MGLAKEDAPITPSPKNACLEGFEGADGDSARLVLSEIHSDSEVAVEGCSTARVEPIPELETT